MSKVAPQFIPNRLLRGNSYKSDVLALGGLWAQSPNWLMCSRPSREVISWNDMEETCPRGFSPIGTAEVAAAGQLCQPGMLRISGEVSGCVLTAVMEPSLNTPKLSSATHKLNPCLQRIKQDLLTLCDCWWHPVRFWCLALDVHYTREQQRYAE